MVEIDPSKLYDATIRTLSDRPIYPVDTVFFHNRSFNDESGLFEIASGMIETRQARFVAVTNNDGEGHDPESPVKANPGKTYFINGLLEKGVPRNLIVVPDMEATNMRMENKAFIELARQRRWTRAAVLTQPHQLLGAMLGAVQEMNQSGYMMRLFAMAPNPTLWEEIVTGSQGRERKARGEHIRDEYEGRIVYRSSTGELATLDELIDYLKARDRGEV